MSLNEVLSIADYTSLFLYLGNKLDQQTKQTIDRLFIDLYKNKDSESRNKLLNYIQNIVASSKDEEIKEIAKYCAKKVKNVQLSQFMDYCDKLIMSNPEGGTIFYEEFLSNTSFDPEDEKNESEEEEDDVQTENEEQIIRKSLFQAEKLQQIGELIDTNNHEFAFLMLVKCLENNTTKYQEVFDKKTLTQNNVIHIYEAIEWAYLKYGAIKLLKDHPYLVGFILLVHEVIRINNMPEMDKKLNYLRMILEEMSNSLGQLSTDKNEQKLDKTQENLVTNRWSGSAQGNNNANFIPLDSAKIEKILTDLSRQNPTAKRDSFFLATAAALNNIRQQEGGEYNVFSLRVTCQSYVTNPEINQWVKTELKSKNINYEMYVESILLPTPDLPENTALWMYAHGEPSREGRILAQELNIKFHIINNRIENGELKHEHLLIDKDTCKVITPATVDYKDPKTVHLFSHDEHFRSVTFDDQIAAYKNNKNTNKK